MLTYIRILRIVAVSAAVGFLAAWGQYSWSSQMERAAERADKNVRIVEEYVLRVVLTQEALLAEADEATDGFTWDEISASKFVHERLKRTGDRSGNSSSIGLIDPSGRIRNSGRAFPVDTDVSDREYFQKIRDGTVPLFIGDRIVSRLSGEDVIAIARRRGEAKTFEGVVAMSLRTQVISDFFGKLSDDKNASTALYADDGSLLARYPNLPPMKLPSDSVFMRAMGESNGGVFQTRAVSDGVGRLYAYARVANLPLFVAYGVAESSINERWLNGMYVACLIAVLALLAGLTLLELAERRLESEARRRQELSSQVAERTTHLRDALAERDSLLKSKDQLLRQKDALLREVHHRVKNNLQMMASMVRVVSRDVPVQSQPVLQDVARRIVTMGRAYDQVHKADDLSKLDLAQYLRGICEQIASTSGRKDVQLVTGLEPVQVQIDTALPVGLITGELLTNAYKHAFPRGLTGSVKVLLKISSGFASVTVRDTGVGLSADQLNKSTGLKIAETLSGQVNGKLRYKNRPEGGVQFRLIFKLPTGKTAPQPH